MAIFVIFVDVCLLFDLLVIGSRMLVFGFYELDKVLYTKVKGALIADGRFSE
jgi:hypothetical protein